MKVIRKPGRRSHTINLSEALLSAIIDSIISESLKATKGPTLFHTAMDSPPLEEKTSTGIDVS